MLKVLIALVCLVSKLDRSEAWFSAKDDKGVNQEGVINTIVSQESGHTVNRKGAFDQILDPLEQKLAILVTCAIISTACNILIILYKGYKAHVKKMAQRLNQN
jgi:hypothetical protein